LGIAVPIFLWKHKTKVAQLELQSWEQQKQNEEQKIEQFIRQKRMN
jgi:cobalt-zinc-cadmium resistance protein CzcA